MGRKLEAVPFFGGAEFPSNTTSPGPRFTFVPSGILIHPAVWPQQTWAENWGLRPLFGEGSRVPIQHQVAWAEAHLHANCHLNPSSRLATTDIGRKLGAPLPFGGRGAGSPSNISFPLSCVDIYHHTKWHLNQSSHLFTTLYGPKIVGCAPSVEGELVDPHLIQCGQGRGLPACQVSS